MCQGLGMLVRHQAYVLSRVKARDACQAPNISVKARDAGQAPSICVKARDACQAPSIRGEWHL